jgi:chemotaxis regulatin CheY-phosphate phosphatase CheZ
MKSKDMSFLLEKADELKDVLSMGQQFIPFLEDIVIFVNDVRPIVEELNQSLVDNVSKLPGVSSKLSQVTQATEVATNEILGLAEELFNCISDLSMFNEQIKEGNIQAVKMNMFLSDLISELKSIDGTGDVINKIQKQLDLTYRNGKLNNFNHKEYSSLINSMQEKTSSIMMSLQIQDITEQQIAAVNHLINIIQDKLNLIVGKIAILDKAEGFEEVIQSGLKETKTSNLHRNVAFDWDIINGFSKTNGIEQTDIDDLFSKNGAAGNDEEIDIDALFAK